MTGKNKKSLSKPGNTSSSTPTKKPKTADPHYLSVNTTKEVSSGGTIRRHPSPAGNGQLVWPLKDNLWKKTGNSTAAYILKSTANTNAYILAVRYFCGRLQLIVRALSVEELTAIGRATMPPWFANLPKLDQNVLTDVLEAA